MMATSGFAVGKNFPRNPCPAWLAPGEPGKAPTYYELLGITPAEADPGRIEAAAVGRVGHVRAYQLAYPAECTLLLNRIALAFETLADPAKRRAYDAQLGRQDDGPGQAVHPPQRARPGRRRRATPAVEVAPVPAPVLCAASGCCDVRLRLRAR
jgi:hypothetical protein